MAGGFTSENKQQEGLNLSDEHLTRLMEGTAEQPLRGSTSSLESWHWGNLGRLTDRQASGRPW